MRKPAELGGFGVWADTFAGRALSWLRIDDIKGNPSRPALPQDVWPLIAAFLSFDAPIQDQIYVLGGRQKRLENTKAYLDSVEMFDWYNRTWTELPPLSVSRVGAAACSAQGCVYIVGGYGTQVAQPTTSMEMFDPQPHKWIACAPMLMARYGHALVALDGEIFALGGDGGANAITDSCEVYSIATNAWREIAPLPVRLAGGRAIVHEGRVLYVGGCSPDALSSVIFSYDPDADIWTEFGTMSVGRSAFALANIEVGGSSRLAIAGGFRAEFGIKPAAELVSLTDPEQDPDQLPVMHHRQERWEKLPALPLHSSGCQAVAVDRTLLFGPKDQKGSEAKNCMLVIGGEQIVTKGLRKPDIYNAVSILDVESKTWVSDVMPPLNVERTAACVCLSPGYPKSYRYFD